MALVGPDEGEGAESFQFTLCTPEWFADNISRYYGSVRDPFSLGIGEIPIVLGRHFLFVQKYDFGVLEKYVRGYCLSCEGPDWGTVGEKVGRLALWEFEDYRPFVKP